LCAPVILRVALYPSELLQSGIVNTEVVSYLMSQYSLYLSRGVTVVARHNPTIDTVREKSQNEIVHQWAWVIGGPIDSDLSAGAEEIAATPGGKSGPCRRGTTAD